MEKNPRQNMVQIAVHLTSSAAKTSVRFGKSSPSESGNKDTNRKQPISEDKEQYGRAGDANMKRKAEIAKNQEHASVS